MSIFSRMARVFRSQKLDQELDEELRSHLEMRAADNMSAGMSAEEAQLAARRSFGNPALIKESTRAQRIVLWLESVLQDARFGLRMLRRSRGFTAVAMLTVALTIGATTAVFAVVHSVLLRPLPYENPDRLVAISIFMPRANDEIIASPQYLAFKDDSRILEAAGAYSPMDFNLSGMGEAERVHAALATASFFTTLGIHPQPGRAFTTDEDKPGAQKVAVLSRSFWKRHFNSEDGVIGKPVRLDNEPYVIIGVLPQSFRFPDTNLQPDVIIPAALPDFKGGDESKPMMIVNVIGRLRPGVSAGQAQNDLQNVLQQYLAGVTSNFGNFFEGATVHARALQTQLVGAVRRPLLIILAAVGCVLLIGCLNIASLQLARAVQRSQEVGVRTALGAGKLRLLRQLITENLVLSACGALGGLLIALAAVALLRAASLSALPAVTVVRVDARVLAFAVLIAIVSGLLFGLAPALWVNRTDPAEAAGKGNRATAGAGHRRFRNLLVVGELAIALVLLAGAGLLVHSFGRVLAVDPGFDPHNVITARLSFPLNTLQQQEQRFALLDNITRELRALPGVESVGITTNLPLMPYDSSLAVIIEGKPEPPRGMAPFVPRTAITPDYFHAMKISLVSGRNFSDSETAPVVIVNQEFARQYFPGEVALGKRFRVPSPRVQAPWLTIVGIAADVHHLGLAQQVSPEIYDPLSQGGIYYGGIFVVRTPEIESTAAALRRIVARLDPSQPVSEIATMDEHLSASLADRRFSMVALGAFALLALLLAGVGIFGVLSYSVAQRTHEIGVRMALGSNRQRVIKLVLREALWLSVAGTFIGAGAALLLTRFMATLLYQTRPTDPLTMIAGSALLVACGMVAGYVPARRASRVDPMIALRAE